MRSTEEYQIDHQSVVRKADEKVAVAGGYLSLRLDGWPPEFSQTRTKDIFSAEKSLHCHPVFS